MEKATNKKEVKRGRPKKAETPVVNEESTHMTMASNYIDEVGVVKNIPQQISLDDIQGRWRNIFNKYSNMSLNDIMTSWGHTISSLNNPFLQNARVKKTNSTPLKIDEETLKVALNDPENNEQTLRSMSAWLAYTNYVYQNLIKINRDVPKFYCYATPLYLNNINKNKIKEDSEKVDKIIKKLNPQLTFKTITEQINIEGKCSYLVRTSYDKKNVNYLVLQKLNSDNVKITGFGSKQRFVVSFNMIVFLEAGYDISQYPQFIRDTWQEMIDGGIVTQDKKGRNRLNPKVSLPMGHMIETDANGRYMYWVKLPQDLCWTFYQTGAHSDAFPDTIGLFEDFNSLDDYRWLQGNLISRGVNSILTGEVPLAYQPKSGADMTAISVDSILGFTDMFNSMVSENVTGFFAPFNDFELHTVEAQPEALDVIYDRVRDLIATSGNSALLSISDKPSISSVQTARMLKEANADYLTKQYQEFLNNIINDNFDLNSQWNISLHGGIFNWREDAKNTKELVSNGIQGLLPKLLSYYDMSLEDYKGATAYIDALDIDIRTVEQKLNIEEAEANEESNAIGRPALDDDEVSNDNTGASKDNGTNDSEIKKMALENLEEAEEYFNL